MSIDERKQILRVITATLMTLSAAFQAAAWIRGDAVSAAFNVASAALAAMFAWLWADANDTKHKA